MKQRALITGINGQDGSYLAELLLAKGYEVYGMVRQNAIENPQQRLIRLREVLDRIRLYVASLENLASIYNMVESIRPHECYHLAAHSHTTCSFDDEFSALRTNIDGTHYLLSAIRKFAPSCRFYFAGSSEMFGKVEANPQRETTPFHPHSLYGISKVAGYYLTRNYREANRIHACTGILFSHESPRRGPESIARKITSGIAAILAGKADRLRIGNPKVKHDWGHAREYVDAMWMMLQRSVPDDYVIASGEAHSVQQFAKTAFQHAGLDWRKHIEVDANSHRPSEDSHFLGDYTKARDTFGWMPRISFADLVAEMVDADCAALGIQSPSSRASTSSQVTKENSEPQIAPAYKSATV
jgi:GDPmannose 4,6-dehydratase